MHQTRVRYNALEQFVGISALDGVYERACFVEMKSWHCLDVARPCRLFIRVHIHLPRFGVSVIYIRDLSFPTVCLCVRVCKPWQI